MDGMDFPPSILAISCKTLYCLELCDSPGTQDIVAIETNGKKGELVALNRGKNDAVGKEDTRMWEYTCILEDRVKMLLKPWVILLLSLFHW